MDRLTHVTDGAPGDPISVFALEMDGARSVDLPHAETDKRTRVIRSDGELWDRNYAAADQDQWH